MIVHRERDREGNFDERVYRATHTLDMDSKKKEH